MKKIFAILLALSAFGLVLSGCKKEEPAAAPADTAGGTAGAGGAAGTAGTAGEAK